MTRANLSIPITYTDRRGIGGADITAAAESASGSESTGYRVRLDGKSHIKGFLLYSEVGPKDQTSVLPRDGLRNSEAPERDGSFILPPFRRGRSMAQHHFLDECRNGSHTITHANRNVKTSDELTFDWLPPISQSFPSNNGSSSDGDDAQIIVFRAAVLVTHAEWYILPPVAIDVAAGEFDDDVVFVDMPISNDPHAPASSASPQTPELQNLNESNTVPSAVGSALQDHVVTTEV